MTLKWVKNNVNNNSLMNEMKQILEDIDVPSLTIEKFVEEKVSRPRPV